MYQRHCSRTDYIQNCFAVKFELVLALQKIIQEAQPQQRQEQSSAPAEPSSHENNDEGDFSELEERIGFIGAGQVTRLSYSYSSSCHLVMAFSDFAYQEVSISLTVPSCVPALYEAVKLSQKP